MQCDANSDGIINVLDIIEEVNCILEDCWEVTSDTNEVLIDIDGNVYNTVQIGNQTWMAENLKVTHYRNGDEISNITNDGTWGSMETGAYGVYQNDPYYSYVYGNLYNWYSINDTRNIAPEGWHIPTDTELAELTYFLGDNPGGKLKESGHEHWIYENDEITSEATNESEFTALPCGYRHEYSGEYFTQTARFFFWSSTENTQNEVWVRELRFNSSEIFRDTYNKKRGCSIRLIKD